MSRAAVFVALTGVLAASLAVLAALIAARRGLEINVWLTLATALVVGLFMAFLWLGPREQPVSGGFDVVGRRRTKVVRAETRAGPADEPEEEEDEAPSEAERRGT